ncbi:GNAT family N-acetyltransferase [Sciscionella sediminilitoris]|uniref:GNAT family N-acetyltransferase n=1 Tax=Sciscionella sediminilitoris TaxID=1445613 RepID=UPI00068E0813|nr:GNAT family N-acetyltransferase [Sciscionella sp. SE31]
MTASPAAPDPETLRGLQERVAKANPAEHVEHLGQWWLRRSAGPSWWTATVLPHGETDAAELAARIAAAERFYAEAGTPARFQISPGACAAELDAVLAARGYRASGAVSLRAAVTEEVRALRAPEGPPAQVREDPSAAWFAAWRTVHGHGGDPGTERDMLERVRQPSAYASVLDGSEVIAVGRAVAEAGWAGVFGMATLPKARGRGAARAVLCSLADWAGTHAAPRMYLQVESGNQAAVRLYERLGFAELCRYHYRTEPGAAESSNRGQDAVSRSNCRS